MSYEQLASLPLQNGVNASAPAFSPTSENTLSEGSWNSIISGDGFVRPFRGMTSMGNGTGSRKMFTFGATWGGIKDIGPLVGTGSFIEDIGRSRWGIGAGQPCIEGVDVSGFTLSTNLKVQIPVGGVYGTPFTAGLAQPSAPEVGIIEVTGTFTNSVSVKLERRRVATGARSVASPCSAVINPQANRIRVTFPTASTGQTHWRVYMSQQGFGGVGIHYLAPYNVDVLDIPETTVAAGTIDGIARSLEFNLQDGDLVPVEASYDDYPPPAATSLLRLESVMNLAGCYVDSTSSPTSTNTGTAIAVSKPNNYESYVPTHLLYLPEQVVDTLARPIDDYGFVACQNSIHAIQYVGDRGDELPPCTITTILPDIGIEYQSNWCHFRGRLLLYTAQGNLLLMDESGNFDTTFANPVTKILQTFTTAGTAVGYDPKTDSIVVAYGNTFLVYSLQSQQWRQVWLPDFVANPANVFSMATAKRSLFISVDITARINAYQYDTGSASTPVSIVTNYQTAQGGNATAKDIYALAISGETGVTGGKLAVSISKNKAVSVFRRITVATGNSHISTAGLKFYSGMVGKKVLIFGDNIATGSTVYFQGVVQAYTSSTDITIYTTGGVPMNPLSNFTELLMFVGDYVAVIDFNSNQPPNFTPNIAEARSYQVAMWFKGTNDVGNLFTCDVFGTAYDSARAL